MIQPEHPPLLGELWLPKHSISPPIKVWSWHKQEDIVWGWNSEITTLSFCNPLYSRNRLQNKKIFEFSWGKKTENLRSVALAAKCNVLETLCGTTLVLGLHPLMTSELVYSSINRRPGNNWPVRTSSQTCQHRPMSVNCQRYARSLNFPWAKWIAGWALLFNFGQNTNTFTKKYLVLASL